ADRRSARQSSRRSARGSQPDRSALVARRADGLAAAGPGGRRSAADAVPGPDAVRPRRGAGGGARPPDLVRRPPGRLGGHVLVDTGPGRPAVLLLAGRAAPSTAR